MTSDKTFDVVVVGGGPAGATVANDLARQGRSVLLLDRAGRIKPCGGAIPPRLIRDFEIPDDLLCAKITSARMISPSGAEVDMPVGKGFVGMVNRDEFDEFLRARAQTSGAERRTGTFSSLSRDPDGTLVVNYAGKKDGATNSIRTRFLIGADGANSAVRREALADVRKPKFVFAYHEIVKAPTDAVTAATASYDSSRCDVYYDGRTSPDFYA